MNILHVKYAVEVAKTKSISQAAENLYTTQPNLSRAIKELEENLGITIFKRNSRGMTLTAEGEEFVLYAKNIVTKLDELETMYKDKKQHKQRFSACVPRASYISCAMTEFGKCIEKDSPAEIYYKETDSMDAIKCVINEDYNLGIIRYEESLSKYFKNIFYEKKLNSETVSEFFNVLLMSKRSPLANKEEVCLEDLSDYIEIGNEDHISVRKSELSNIVDKKIYVYERASQFTLLESLHNAFMWVSPIPKDLLKKYNLIQLSCRENTKLYRDVLIYRKRYKLSDLDNKFINALLDAKRRYL
ncbi:LysR family transcriptional regulator [Alloiococcus sp. CFN-8]|uniref:LysR family transcriptional regulator n=1 Tax=Alloiococcus sp. CFN-8 TaxID=3416081 RepID=UPI003CFAC467